MTSAWAARMLPSALALVVLLLGGYSAWQAMQLSATRFALEQAQRDLEFAVGQVAREQLSGRRDELVRVIAWLDAFYRAPEGLQRPSGLWLKDQDKADGEAIAVWILDTYLPARLGGASEDDARQLVIDGIMATDEWRARHRGR